MEKSTGNKRRQITESEIFLRNVREMYPSLPKSIQTVINSFGIRKDFEIEKIAEIKNMRENKSINKYLVEDEIALDYARKTLGDLNIKSSPDFKPSSDEMISIEDKFNTYMYIQDEVQLLNNK